MNLSRLTSLDPRVPDWGATKLKERHCPLCKNQSGRVQFIRPDGLGVKHCSVCQTFFVSPSPDNERLGRFYAEYDAQHRLASVIRPADAPRVFDALDPLADVRIVKLLSLGTLAGKDVLDVGFGRGLFLYLTKRLGAKTHGLELDPAALEYARYLNLDKVQIGTMENCRWVDRFDIVALNDVIEHPLNPRSLLEAAVRSLRPGGYLSVWTPNGEACIHEREPVTFRVDFEHMQYLTPGSVMHLAADLGLDVVHLETLGHPALAQFNCKNSSLVRFLSQFKTIACSAMGPRLKRKLTMLLRLSRPLASDSRLGRYHLYFILQKNKPLNREI